MVKQIQKVMVVERMVVVVVTAMMSQCVLIVDKNPETTSVGSVFIVSDRKLIRFFSGESNKFQHRVSLNLSNVEIMLTARIFLYVVVTLN